MKSPAAIVADLAKRGIRLEPHGDRLRFHPRSAVTPELASWLAPRKTELISWLRARDAARPESPQRTAGRGYLESPEAPNGLPGSNAEAVFQAKPRNLLPNALPTPPMADWLSMWRRAPQTTLPPTPCGWCGCRVHWQHTLGLTFLCANCRPPSFPQHVARWVEVVATEDGPQVVTVGGPPTRA